MTIAVVVCGSGAGIEGSVCIDPHLVCVVSNRHRVQSAAAAAAAAAAADDDDDDDDDDALRALNLGTPGPDLSQRQQRV